MPSSLYDLVEKEMECEELFECMSGSSNLDRDIYFHVLESDGLDVDQIAEEVERERSTVYRSVQRLKENSFLEQEKIGQKGGGYRHVYTAVDPDEIADRMQDKLNEMYAEIGQLIHEFRNKYSD
jgi:predicted transcriptional regulator